jgi:hypothetical protein
MCTFKVSSAFFFSIGCTHSRYRLQRHLLSASPGVHNEELIGPGPRAPGFMIGYLSAGKENEYTFNERVRDLNKQV